jgi:hypothetical protein
MTTESGTRTNCVEELSRFHATLKDRFQELKDERARIAAPVFALEHGLDATDLASLQDAVKQAVLDGMQFHHRKSWLAFVVYAAEVAYRYDGSEYWQTFEDETPGWRGNSSYRDYIRTWFKRFASDFGGAQPRGAWADKFTIVAWPITHAVLPKYLQVHLAELLFNTRALLTGTLLADPDSLGSVLAAHAYAFTERFRVFCENTSLLGRTAAALLSGAGGESPYLTPETLGRLVGGIEEERRARSWWTQAQQAANRVRLGGFVPSSSTASGSTRRSELSRSLPAPELSLGRVGTAWRVFVGLPDLRSVSERLPALHDLLRTARPLLRGRNRPLARGQLLIPGQRESLDEWPPANEPLIVLEGASDTVNATIGDYCLTSPGPWWVFKERANGTAVEVRGKALLAGEEYVLLRVGTDDCRLPWAEEVPISTAGVTAFRVAVPAEAVTDSDASVLIQAGLSLLSRVIARPVGVVADSWDGQGAVEWTSGQLMLLGINAQQPPQECRLAVDTNPYVLPWPSGESELVVSLEGLGPGRHTVTIGLHAQDGHEVSHGELDIVVRDALARADTGSPGEGLRLVASPAQPSLDELWQESTVLEVQGPPGLKARVEATLLSDQGQVIASVSTGCVVPVDHQGWRRMAQQIRWNDPQFKAKYDQAAACRIRVFKDGVGFAAITCERPFAPLAWRIKPGRGKVARTIRLVDQTDDGQTQARFFDIMSPLTGHPWDVADTQPVPSHGGLIVAEAAVARASIILPPDPNELRSIWKQLSGKRVPAGGQTPDRALELIDGYGLWADAELPGDPFARTLRDQILDQIDAALSQVLAGPKWADLERDDLTRSGTVQAARATVFSEPGWPAALGAVINGLCNWVDEGAFVAGLASAVAPLNGPHDPDAPFVVALASRPAALSRHAPVSPWDDPELVRRLLTAVIRRPRPYMLARLVTARLKARRQEDN